MPLSPDNEIAVSALSVGTVLGVFAIMTPTVAQTRMTTPVHAQVHGSVRSAVLTSAVIVGGIAFLGKSPAVAIAGGVTTVLLAWNYYHANSVNPEDSKYAQVSQVTDTTAS